MSAAEKLGDFAQRWLALRKWDRFVVFRLLLVIAAIVYSVVSITLFEHQEDQHAWQTHFLSVLLFICAFISVPKKVTLQKWLTQQNVWASIALLIVAAIALFMRLHQLEQFPQTIFFDEADNAAQAIKLVRNTDVRPVYVESTNLPAHFLYVMAWMFQHYGGNALAMRYTTVLFGVATVILAFLLFKRWFGWPVAFLGAFCLAVMRWNLTFSRLAMHGITVPFFVFLAVYLLDRAWANRRLFDWALLGLALGFSLCFYTPLRVLPVAIIGFLGLMALITFIKQRSIGKAKEMMAPAIVLLLGLLIAVAPFGQYALRKPEVVFARTEEVSFFNSTKRLEPSLPGALWNQVSQYFLMFNVRGDSNPRHNLPDAPLLDPIMGALFLVGAGMALWRINRRNNALMWILLIAMNLPGIFSLEIEAPHALRSIGTMMPALYFICLPLAWLYQRFSQISGPKKATFAAALCAVVGFYNYYWFFEVQAKDPRVAAAYSPADTLVAREANRLISANNDVILSDNFRYQPIAEFLIHDLSHVQSWNGQPPLTLPNPRDRNRDLSIIVAPDFLAPLQSLQTTCASATLAPVTSPIDQSTIAYALHLPKGCP